MIAFEGLPYLINIGFFLLFKILNFTFLKSSQDYFVNSNHLPQIVDVGSQVRNKIFKNPQSMIAYKGLVS